MTALTNQIQTVGESEILRLQDSRTSPTLTSFGTVDRDATPALKVALDTAGQIGLEVVNYQDILGAVPDATAAAGYALRVFSLGWRRYQLVYTLTAATLTTVDGGGSGAGGGVKLLDFVQGTVRPLGGFATVTSIVATGGAGGNTVLDIGVGTVIADNSQETLATTKEDLLAGNQITLATGVFSAGSVGSGAPAWASAASTTIINGTSTAADAYFNIAAGAAAHGAANGAITLNGVVSFGVELMPDY